MKKLSIPLFLMLALLLAACSPAAVSEPTPRPTMEVEPTPVVDRPERPDQGSDSEEDGMQEVTWEQSPETVVITVKLFGGFVPENFVRNYIPDAQYYGDGQVIWVNFRENGSRAVLEGQIETADLQAILERIAASGFYDWEARYANPLIADAPERCIEVNTLEREKSVCEYVEGAPPEFHELYEWLVRGAGVSGEPYIPERGLVTSYPVPGQEAESVQGAASWEVQDGPDLAGMQNGEWLEGPALLQAWQIVNASGSGALVQQGDNFYQLSVQVPGVSLEGPWSAQ